MSDRSPSTFSQLWENPPAGFVAVLLAVHVLWAVWALGQSTHPGDHTDLNRFQQIADARGRPYRDFQVEYAPVEVIAIELLAGPTLTSTHRTLVGLALLLDFATWLALIGGWGRLVGARYLLLAVPLLPLFYIRLDLLVVALAVGGLALARRGRDRLGGVVLAIATLTKVWPGFAAPSLLARPRLRGMAWFLVTTVMGAGIWVAVSGADAVHQVATFRDATGWEFESTIGAMVWLLGRGPVRFELGAARVGIEPPWVRVALLGALVIVTLTVWLRARRWSGLPEGVPTLIAVTASIALSPVLSLQYAIWLLPWIAIASTETAGRAFVRVAAAVLILTGALMAIYLWAPVSAIVPVVAVIVLARNALCVALVVTWFCPWPKDPQALQATEPGRMKAAASAS